MAPTPIITSRNEDSGSAAKYTFTSQNNSALVLKKKDSTVQCNQTTATKSRLLNYFKTNHIPKHLFMNIIKFSRR